MCQRRRFVENGDEIAARQKGDPHISKVAGVGDPKVTAEAKVILPFATVTLELLFKSLGAQYTIPPMHRSADGATASAARRVHEPEAEVAFLSALTIALAAAAACTLVAPRDIRMVNGMLTVPSVCTAGECRRGAAS